MLDNVKDLSIYLGRDCNFNCNYCDRDYLKEHFPHDKWHELNDNFFNFIKYVIDELGELHTLSFHGGEPFLFVKEMTEVINWLHETGYHDKVGMIFIQTNGSRIKKFPEFFDLSDKIYISISYDHIGQTRNRTKIDLEGTLDLLREKNVNCQLQTVIDMTEEDFFKVTNVANIINLNETYENLTCFNFIFLRAIRKPLKFRLLLDEVDFDKFFNKMLWLMIFLKDNGVYFTVDGIFDSDTHKSYLENHYQLIMSPDGYLYSEYDLLEYYIKDFRVGKWDEEVPVIERKVQNTDDKFEKVCQTCPMNYFCGAKFYPYIYKGHISPNLNCQKFYKMFLELYQASQYFDVDKMGMIARKILENAPK